MLIGFDSRLGGHLLEGAVSPVSIKGVIEGEILIGTRSPTAVDEQNVLVAVVVKIDKSHIPDPTVATAYFFGVGEFWCKNLIPARAVTS